MSQRIIAPHPRRLDEVVGRNLPQWAVDFVVIDLEKDYQAGLYLTLKLANSHPNPIVRKMYSDACRFFTLVHQLMTSGDPLSLRRARQMLVFPEAQEIRLGYSGIGSYGSGIGNSTLSEHVFNTLLAQPQLREALTVEPDALCFIPWIAMDRSSDIVATIVKQQLIGFTQSQANFWGFDSNCLAQRTIENCWDEKTQRLIGVRATVPVDDLGRPFLLVPKEICRSAPPMTAGQYFRDIGGSPRASGASMKEQMLDDAAAHAGRLPSFVADRMADPDRFKPRAEFRPKKKE